MPGWIVTLILMAISGLTGLAVGYVLGADSWQAEHERRPKDEQHRPSQ